MTNNLPGDCDKHYWSNVLIDYLYLSHKLTQIQKFHLHLGRWQNCYTKQSTTVFSWCPYMSQRIPHFLTASFLLGSTPGAAAADFFALSNQILVYIALQRFVYLNCVPYYDSFGLANLLLRAADRSWIFTRLAAELDFTLFKNLASLHQDGPFSLIDGPFVQALLRVISLIVEVAVSITRFKVANCGRAMRTRDRFCRVCCPQM